jgi:hypothetical protein
VGLLRRSHIWQRGVFTSSFNSCGRGYTVAPAFTNAGVRHVVIADCWKLKMQRFYILNGITFIQVFVLSQASVSKVELGTHKHSLVISKMSFSF